MDTNHAIPWLCRPLAQLPRPIPCCPSTGNRYAECAIRPLLEKMFLQFLESPMCSPLKNILLSFLVFEF